MYTTPEALYGAMRKQYKADSGLFEGCYDLTIDTLVTHREHVRMSAEEAWKATGYRFT